MGRFDPVRLVKDTLPKVLRSPSKYVPVFKYLKGAGLLEKNEISRESKLDDRVVAAANATHDNFLPPNWYRAQITESRRLGSVDAILEKEPVEKALFMIPLMATDQIDVNALRKFLAGNLNLLNAKSQLHKTYVGSLICLYDLLAFGPGSEQQN